MAVTQKLHLINPASKNSYALVKAGAIVNLGDTIVVGDIYKDGEHVILLVNSQLRPETLETLLAPKP